jgi:Na+/H+ antiporter NhaD/arsenite permease-like protein
MAHARRPLILLGAVVATSGIFSAFLVNDAICLVLAPLVLELTLALGRRPVPYLLAVAMASTLAGNFTVLGSIANLIVVQKAGESGVVIGFWDYFRVGAPLTIITLAIGTLWLWL